MIRSALIDAYAAVLLDNPPVRCLQHGEVNREKDARRLATKDVRRVLKAAETAGLTLVRREG